MNRFRLEDMVKGWFVGDFEPAAFASKDVEVAIKKYQAGDYEEIHYHKVATEITVVISGEVKMLDQVWSEGDIIVLEPGTATDFTALTNAVNAVVKIPGVLDDKYPGLPPK